MQQKKLTVAGLVQDLVSDQRLSVADAKLFAAGVRQGRTKMSHPIELIDAAGLTDMANPAQTLTAETLMLWLSKRSDLSYYRVDPLKIDTPLVTRVMSGEFARRHQILAVEVNAREILILCSEPYVTSWVSMIEQSQIGKTIVRALASPADIRRYTDEFYAMANSVKKASAQGLAASALGNLEQMVELGQLDSMEANDTHIVNIVDWLLQYAFTQRASDIHIEPRREKGATRFRIDGILHTVYELPMPVVSAVISRIKTLGRMNVAEKRRPQDGRLKTRTPNGQEIELRLSTLPTAFGEKLVMRIFDPAILLKSFSELGLEAQEHVVWSQMVGQPNGIVLVTGPTGSGKTTTLYTSLKQLATEMVNVCTIEDPIEMVEDAFNQMQVQANIDLSFAEGVRALLRQDPDIIMVGEIRDLETAEMAIQAALTGHLVISTLHTNDAPAAITRMLELGVAPYLIKATLLGVMAQRLVRTFCPHCRYDIEPDLDGWAELVHPWGVEPPLKMAAAAGCQECRETGFKGRAGLYELLTMNDSVKQLVVGHADAGQIRKAGMQAGMRTLRLSGAEKVAKGETSIAEVLRVAPVSSYE
ncbi:MAG: type II/IV secretion system protein [Gammaproteobacteria bacterium]|jgi:general secretion pathway protein E|nr:type II/IV secretion system protein [Gammaproteobacteria bacterium]